MFSLILSLSPALPPPPPPPSRPKSNEKMSSGEGFLKKPETCFNLTQNFSEPYLIT